MNFLRVRSIVILTALTVTFLLQIGYISCATPMTRALRNEFVETTPPGLSWQKGPNGLRLGVPVGPLTFALDQEMVVTIVLQNTSSQPIEITNIGAEVDFRIADKTGAPYNAVKTDQYGFHSPLTWSTTNYRPLFLRAGQVLVRDFDLADYRKFVAGTYYVTVARSITLSPDSAVITSAPIELRIH